MSLAKRRLHRATWTLAIFTLAASAVHAEHAAINLQVIGPKGRQEASADQEPPPGGVNPRPRLTVKAGDPLVLHYILTNVYPHGILKGVTVRYLVFRTGKIKSRQLPESAEGVVTQGSAKFNFKPKCRVGARLAFRIDEPGIYVVRIDTLNTKSDHEHFSAIDLEVK